MLDPVHFPQFIAPRVARTISRLEASVWLRDAEPLAVAATAPSPEQVDVLAARRLKFRAVTQALPYTWGRLFDQRWWKLRLPKPKNRGEQRYLFWGDQAEATLYQDGSPIFGFDPGHDYCPLPADARDLLIESICCRTGVWIPDGNVPMSTQGSVFGGAYLAKRDDDVWHALHDLQVLTETLMLVHLPDYTVQDNPMGAFGYRPPIHQAPPIFRSVLRQINDAIDLYDRSGAAVLRRALQRVYRSLAIPKRSHNAVLTGHAHIDLAWLWPKRVARSKAVHSFANALSVIERYPEVHFGYSQPASYRDTQMLSPKLMDRVRSCIRTGKWEATGTMEVESDTQLPCGEALVRSFELGRKGFLELNGKRRGPGRVVWLPDTFGYSACIPQIMAGFGVPYFFTTKIHWSSATRLPYTSFRWQGNDGSEVLAHIIQDHYNLSGRPKEYQRIAMKHQQADVHPEVLCPTGYGDGGGGPNDAMAERVQRMGKLGMLGEAAGVPQTRWGRIDSFFDRLNDARGSLPTWRGEMYLQYHRGVQTTHANLKAAYRAAERALQVWEAVRCATGKGPIDESAWQTVVFNQFHDILPGSSIWEVCVEAVDELTAVTKNATDNARDELTRSGGKPCVFNPLAMPNYVVTDTSVSRVPPLAGVLIDELEAVLTETPVATRKSLENQRVSVCFDDVGQIRSLTIDGKPVSLQEPGAQLWSFPDHPVTYDAWDVDRATLSNGERVSGPARAGVEHKGTLNAAVCFKRKLGPNSEAVIRYRLDPVRPLLLIELDIEWHEEQTLLKMSFPTGYTGHSARYGSPFGSTLRPQLPGPIEHDAMFEAPGSRWAAVANDTETDGLALVTEAKYGFGCMGGLLHVSLLRSAKITPPTQGPPRRTVKGRRGVIPIYSDIGRHKIRLAVGRFCAQAPHEEQPAACAESLFNPPIAYTGRPVSAGLRAINAGPGVIPAWAKPVTKNRWTLRLHETLGQDATCKIDAAADELSRLDLNDEVQGRVTRRGVRVKPYEITSIGITKD